MVVGLTAALLVVSLLYDISAATGTNWVNGETATVVVVFVLHWGMFLQVIRELKLGN